MSRVGIGVAPSIHIAARQNVGVGGEDDDPLVVGGARREQHALAFLAAHHARGEIGHDYQILADQIFRLIVGLQSGDDLPFFVAQVDLEYKEFVGIRMNGGFDDPADPHFDFDEFVKSDEVTLGFGRFTGFARHRSFLSYARQIAGQSNEPMEALQQSGDHCTHRLQTGQFDLESVG